MAHGNTLDPLQGNHTYPQRMDSDTLGAAERPKLLQQNKLGRRESRLGLRNLFGRSSKTAKEQDGPAPQKVASLSGSLRASIAEMSHWPYGQQTRSEIALSTAHQPWETPYEQPGPGQHHSRGSNNGGSKRKPGMATPKQSRNALAAWTPPPLFKAYPQAIRQGTLPAVTISADTILRLNEKKNLSGVDPAASIVDVSGENQGADKEKPKRRLRSDSLAAGNLQWTTKIYFLVTSGYLLQYSSDGHFDRLPEKVLRLGQSSAAFATDVIPGRHWVLQISAAADSDGAPSTDSRSLFSRLPFRIPDRRQTSNLFMVFESAEDMEEWLTSLRGAIEKLGGKKPVSDTEAVKGDDIAVHLRARPSQRTIVVKDPTRFSQVITSPSHSWEEDEEPRASVCSTTVTDYDATTQDATPDDASTTNSVVSQDGRQLDSLRDSANRLSLLSSGQRTVVTSTTSSPASSPILDRFPRPGDKLPVLRDLNAMPEARPRPNAGVILNRRMSLQTVGPFIGESDLAGVVDQRPASSCGRAPRGDVTLSPLGSHPTPNFSVPNSSSRRFSYVKLSSIEPMGPPPPPKDGLMVIPRSTLRKLSTIRAGRPLSTVEDQPSPKESIPERPATCHYDEPRPSTPPAEVPRVPRGRLMSVQHMPSRDLSRDGASGRRLSWVSGETEPYPRRLSSLGALGKQANTGEMMPLQPLVVPLVVVGGDDGRRSRSSLDPSELKNRSGSVSRSRAAKRASIGSIHSDRSTSGDVHITGVMESPSRLAPPPMGPLPPIPRHSTASKQVMKVVMPTKVLVSKRSMPQLAVVEGPPPAPPPTCALPPIPQKPATEA